MSIYYYSGEASCVVGLTKEAEYARLLAEDLDLLASGRCFSSSRLAAAPFLVRSQVVTMPTDVAMGMICRLGTAPKLGHTGPIVVDGSAAGWVRTRDGLYRCGSLVGSWPGTVQWPK